MIPKHYRITVPDRPDTRAAPSYRQQGSYKAPRNRPCCKALTVS